MSDRKINFRKATLDNLEAPPKGQRIIYYDSRVPHLGLRVSDSGTKTFIVYRWVEGRALKRTLGRYPELSIEQARKLSESVNSELSHGRDPLEKKREARNELTLGQLFVEYQENYGKEHTKTWKDMQDNFERYLKCWHSRKLSLITKTDVQSLVNKLGREKGHTTANRTLELLRAIINKGIKWGLYSKSNPASGVDKFKLKPRTRFLTDDEIPRLINSLERERQVFKDYVLISLYTGVRKSNVLAMRWDQLDLESGTWTIPETKNGTSQTICLTGEELKILQARFDSRKNFEWVFPSVRGSGHMVSPIKMWQSTLKRAGIEDLHLHDLRRSLGSYMAMTGASLSVIGNALNHKDVSTTRKVYAQTARDAEKRAREVAHNAMFKQPATKNLRIKQPSARA